MTIISSTIKIDYPAKNTKVVDLSGKIKQVWFNRFDEDSCKVILDYTFKNGSKKYQDEMRVSPERFLERFIVARKGLK